MMDQVKYFDMKWFDKTKKKKERLITGYKIVYTNEAPLNDTNTPWDKYLFC